MSGIAQGWIQGNLTADPELRKTKADKAVCGMRIAVNDTWTDRDGTRQESVSYFQVTIFGKQAETCHTFLHKGDEASVVGRLRQGRWEDDNGNARERVEIIADQVNFGRKKGDRSARGDNGDEAGADSSGEKTAA